MTRKEYQRGYYQRRKSEAVPPYKGERGRGPKPLTESEEEVIVSVTRAFQNLKRKICASTQRTPQDTQDLQTLWRYLKKARAAL